MPDSTAFNDQPYLTRRGFIAGLMAMPAAAAIPGMPSREFTMIIQESDSVFMYWAFIEAAESAKTHYARTVAAYGRWEGVKWVTA